MRKKIAEVFDVLGIISGAYAVHGLFELLGMPCKFGSVGAVKVNAILMVGCIFIKTVLNRKNN